MKKPQGWMDENHDAGLEPALVHDGSTASSHHRLISWDQVGEGHDLSENLPPPYGTELLSCPVKCSAETFVLRVRGSSMEPKFREGELIFVDPLAPANHGKFVVVRLAESNEVTFKQLVLEDGNKYLKALNPDWPNRIVQVPPDTAICGVIVFKGEAL
jgi:SOS-response transcriptional repressor LexA